MALLCGFVLITVTIILLERLCRWRLDLYGHNTAMSTDKYQYIFAVQNGEDIPLIAPFRISVVIDESRHGFDGEPQLYCGPIYKTTRVAVSKIDDEISTFTVDCNELPAFDTWVIQFKSGAHPSNVRLVVGLQPRRTVVDRSRSLLFPLFSESELRLGPGQETPVLTPRPSWGVGGLATALAIGLYLFPILYGQGRWHLVGGPADTSLMTDITIVLFLAGLSLLVLHASRRQPVPVIQGYLDVQSATERHSAIGTS